MTSWKVASEGPAGAAFGETILIWPWGTLGNRVAPSMLGAGAGTLGNPAAPSMKGGPAPRVVGILLLHPCWVHLLPKSHGRSETSLEHPAFLVALLQEQQPGLLVGAVAFGGSQGVPGSPIAPWRDWGFGGYWGSPLVSIPFGALPSGYFTLSLGEHLFPVTREKVVRG